MQNKWRVANKPKRLKNRIDTQNRNTKAVPTRLTKENHKSNMETNDIKTSLGTCSPHFCCGAPRPFTWETCYFSNGGNSPNIHLVPKHVQIDLGRGRDGTCANHACPTFPNMHECLYCVSQIISIIFGTSHEHGRLFPHSSPTPR